MLSRLLASLATGVLLVLAAMFSAVVLALLAVVGVAVGLYFWWKTRALRRQADGQFVEVVVEEADADVVRPGGLLIEGEVIRRDVSTGDDDEPDTEREQNR